MALQSNSRKRRRRRRSASARPSAQTIRRTRRPREFRLHTTEILASIGVALASAMLIVLLWLNITNGIDSEYAATRARIEATAGGQALVLAEEVRRELLGVEQSLRILKQAFQADPINFDMKIWRDQLSALTDVTEEVFVADAQLIIRFDSNPQAVGSGIGSRASTSFQATSSAAHDDSLLIGTAVQSVQSRQYMTFLMIRLDRPGGWYAGGSYRTEALTRLYAEAPLGLQGMTALINTKQGRVQALSGPAATSPGYEIGKSAMYEAMQLRPDGTWIGLSAPDEIQRIHAFRRVPGRDLSVVVAVNEAAAMRPAVSWAESARALAWGGTVVVLLLTATALRAVWTFRATRRRNQALERERAIVAGAQLDIAELRSRVEGRSAQVKALLASVTAGVLVVDREQRVAECNPHFAGILGVPPEVPQTGLPLDELLRSLARAGAFGPLDDIENEVGRRTTQLRVGGESALTGADGVDIGLLSVPLADGGLVLVVGDYQRPRPPAQSETVPAEPVQTWEPSPEGGSLETL